MKSKSFFLNAFASYVHYCAYMVFDHVFLGFRNSLFELVYVGGIASTLAVDVFLIVFISCTYKMIRMITVVSNNNTPAAIPY